MKLFTKVTTFLSFLFSSSLVCADLTADRFILVTDIDDTVKVSHVTHPVEAFKHWWSGGTVFAGMPELYQEFMKQAEVAIYLSGSPATLSKRVKDILVQSGFPSGQFLHNDWSSLYNWFTWYNVLRFKSHELSGLAVNWDLPFMFVGDDTQYDPHVYSMFKRSHSPDKTLGIYIHQIRGRALPEGIIPFYTAFDIALHELEQGRISLDGVKNVGLAILEDNRPELLFPYYKVCPRNLSHELGPRAKEDPEISALSVEIRQYVSEYCSRGLKL